MVGPMQYTLKCTGVYIHIDTYFLFIKPTKQEILHSMRPLLPRFCAKNSFITFLKRKCCKNHGQCLKSVSFQAAFLYDENIDDTEKKALNSDFEQGQLHGLQKLNIATGETSLLITSLTISTSLAFIII